jgi:colanic acid/amylovoran biosynthesis glycosyltransferase
MRLAYLIGRYPAISHTFILREVQALRERGLDVHTFSIWRTDRSQLLAPEDREEAARTFSVLPRRPLRVVAAHAAALARSPAACLATLRMAVGLGVPGVRGRLLALSWYVEAITLWRAMARRRIRHVHAHLNGTAPAVALLIAGFARATRERWTWSMTVHGPAEFYDVAGGEGTRGYVRRSDQ